MESQGLVGLRALLARVAKAMRCTAYATTHAIAQLALKLVRYPFLLSASIRVAEQRIIETSQAFSSVLLSTVR